VPICVGAGYLFGNLDFVKNNFSVVILAIVFISVLPMAITFINEKRKVTA
jgi:membrane-associated protein